MPIKRQGCGYGLATKTFEDIDRVVMGCVIDEALWEKDENRWSIPILPNRPPCYGLMDSSRRVEDHVPGRYFALACLGQGLKYPETSLWLDTSLEKFERRLSDGRTVRTTAEMDTIVRLDRRKPIYFFGGVPRYVLTITLSP